MFASWENFDFLELFRHKGHISPLPRRKPDQPGGRYIIDVVSAFDIETSRIDLPIPKGAKQNSHSFMYIWQMAAETPKHDIVYMLGRTWQHFREIINEINSKLEDMEADIICYVHNLSYEFAFISTAIVSYTAADI